MNDTHRDKDGGRTQSLPLSTRWRTASLVIGLWSATLGLTSIACYASYRGDQTRLRLRAEEIVEGIQDPNEKVLTLNTWVQRHLATKQNASDFIFAGLRATPLQVLHSGGDCADKSRLLAAMLREISIPASMALCFNPKTGQPSHTVVETQPGPDSHMLVDPAYELFYPKPDGHRYYGLLALRRHPERLEERLTYLWNTVPRFRPLHSYRPEVASFVGLSTVNWHRNQITKLVRDILFLFIGSRVYDLPRPLVLEEPKLAVAVSLALLSFILLVCRYAVRHLTKHTPIRSHIIGQSDGPRNTVTGSHRPAAARMMAR